ncbi:MAG TPA: hypothetical protein VFM94_00505 [Solirubrobacterales bacterium]|nr:hypothetical protein [Solirubrobacterales bacterium]
MRLELVAARPCAEVAAPGGECANQRKRRLRLLATQLVLKRLSDELGDGYAALIGYAPGAFQ